MNRHRSPSISHNKSIDHHELMVVLEQKDRDLELAAKIGQSLLEQNKDLQTKNEFLEESVNRNLETIIQLKHELNQRIELLRVYSHLDDDGVPRSNSDETLRERLKSTKSENERLRRECEALRQETIAAGYENKNAKALERQLDDANEKVTYLQKLIEQKQLELSSQYEKTGKLVKKLGDKERQQKMATLEKEEMSAILIEMIQKHDTVQTELKDIQDQYAELMANFAETESELNRHRQAASLRMSFDSLYDSLASEMESSEAGISPKLLTAIREHDEKDSGNETSLAAEIEQIGDGKMAEVDYHFSKKHVAPIFCDASTSCTDIFVKTESEQISIPTSSKCTSSFDKLTISEEEPSFNNIETSTPKVVRKIVPISPKRQSNNLEKLQKLHINSAVTKPTIKEQQNSDDELDKYDEPKLGQPGIPGTRDLSVSLKVIKAREEVQKKFAAYCHKKGIDEKEFFGGKNSRRRSNDQTIKDFSAAYGIKMLQNLKSDECLQLNNTRHGVLTRAELHIQSPTGSPQHHRSPFSSLSLSPSSSLKIGSTLPLGVIQRR